MVTKTGAKIISLRLRPLLIGLLLTLPGLTGCAGCRRDDPDAQANRSPDMPAAVDEFTFAGAVPLPAGGSIGTSAVKVGHWFTLRQSLRSNQSDLRGDLTYRTSVGLKSSDGATLAEDSIGLICQRPAVLPKGRMKRLDVRLLAAADRFTSPMKVSTSGEFTSGSAFISHPRVDHPTMLGHEYFFVILTTRPERFASFQAAAWVRASGPSDSLYTPTSQFRLVFPRTGGLLSLPETMLDWTSTAFVFWDDIAPSELTAEQRRALTDWLHFGGRMIVNGNAVASELTNSELGRWLPIEFSGMRALEAVEATELIENWSVKEDDSRSTVAALVQGQASRVAIAGDLTEDAIPIKGTAELLAARRIGRGEIVMSRFDLTSDWLLGWRSRDSFFNATALARPARNFSIENGKLLQGLADDASATGRRPAPPPAAMINSSLRLTSRDARLKADADNEIAWSGDEFAAHPHSGLGGWRDDSDAARLLQSVLREQAGVSIPPRPFVIQSLAVYLAILVPANYLFFRLLGRLEWAWLAVPLLALMGAGWIARTVSLDLGLARNRSEVSLIEMQPGYPRGHLTRFAAIYNSLSGVYQIAFDSPDAAAAPVEVAGQTKVSPCVFRYGYGDGPTLERFSVPSNRTRVFHAEQVLDIGGPIELQGNRLINRSSLRLFDVVVIRRSSENRIEQAAVGPLDAGATIRLRWTDTSAGEDRSIISAFIQSKSLPIGSTRLLGRLDETLPGMTIAPETPQQSATTVVLAHLTHAPQLRSTGDTSLMPSRKERERLLIDDELDSSSVKEIKVP